MRVAIMQPYHIPYLGYFRLFAATDLFVVYDDVQFIRRGRVHRNKLLDANGIPQWLTLPLVKCPQETKIKDLEFRGSWKKEQLLKFPVLFREDPLVDALINIWGEPVNYITNLLRLVCERLSIPFNVVNSSTLDLPESLRAEDRILEIASRFGATEYVNAPGGRGLYDVRNFAKRGISLKFLPDYEGDKISVMQRILEEDKNSLRKEVYAQL